VMMVEEMNGTIRLLHNGWATDDQQQDWRPVVIKWSCSIALTS